MKNRLITVRGIVMLMLAMLAWAQTRTSAQSKYLGQYMMPDPQIWSSIRYGGQIPDLYTGTVRADIPIYTYEDPDFEIPISLIYASNGYMSNVQANFVGLGWTLNAGGCITRCTRGIKDDSSEAHGGLSVMGFWQYSEIDHDSSPVLDRTIGGDQSLAYYSIRTSDGSCSQYETESDIYMFSFFGHTGKFVIGDDGSVMVYDTGDPSGEYSVDLSDYGSSTFRSRISISTGDGYRYVFGGIDSPDITYSHEVFPYEMNVQESLYTRDERPDFWMLTSVIAPNGRIVTYSYTMDSTCALDNLCPYSSIYSYSVSIDTGGRRCLRGGYNASGEYPTEGYTLQRNYIPRLDSISIGDVCMISFTYGEREQEIGYRSATRMALSTPLRLDGIAVRFIGDGSQEARTILDCDLGYRYTEGNRVMLLNDVHIIGDGHYRMTYYNEDSRFPYQGSSRIDHWGYFNSNADTTATGLLPQLILEDDYTETIQDNRRTPDSSRSVFGMLRRLYYPLGGYTEYEYEPHDYSRKVERRSNVNMGRPTLSAPSSTALEAGGQRIRRIVDHASDGVESVRTYSYVSDGISSGIMLEFPRYSRAVRLATILNYCNKDILSSFIPTYMMDRTHIEYSRVTETYGDGSSRTTFFRCYADTPDITDDINERLIDGTYGNVEHWEVTFPENSGNLFKDYSSRYLKRGLKKRTEIRNASGDIIHSEDIEYADDEEKYTESVHFSTDSAYVLKNYLNDRSVIMHRTVTDGCEAIVSNVYNSKQQPRVMTSSNGDGTYRRTYFYYPHELTDTSGSIESQMTDAGMISQPLVLVNTCGDDNAECITKVMKTIYKRLGTGHGMFVRESESLAIIPDLGQSSLTWDAINTTIRSFRFKTLFSWNTYNTLGRPCAVMDSNGIQHVILWGYGGMYPVALACNCNIHSLDSAGIEATSISGWSGLSETDESALRAIQGASVYTWKHVPLVGVSQKTGPEGRSTSYTYDDNGCLLAVYGSDGEKKAEYHHSIITETE